MGQRWRLHTETQREHFMADIGRRCLAGQKPVVQFVDESRTLDQNAMFYALYGQVAAQKQDETVLDIKRHCKLVYGVLIVRTGDPEYKYLYDKAIKSTLTHEEKLEAMDFWPVTSLMGKKQGSEYIDTIIREYSKQGISLIHPSEVA